LARVGRGRYALGATLIAMADTHALHRLIAALGAPIVRALAQRTGLAAHLGVFEGDMVTYLIKAGRDSARIFTKEGMQLEAYCSGIGKVLLAHLPAAERRRYLATGPFIELTPNTITDPRALASALDDVRARGFACDNCEIDLNLRCIAAPVRNAASEVVAAISVSSRAADQSIDGLQKMLPTLQAAAGELELALDPPPRQARHAG
jgi:DNA-binding IclR family transcriptional regulator